MNYYWDLEENIKKGPTGIVISPNSNEEKRKATNSAASGRLFTGKASNPTFMEQPSRNTVPKQRYENESKTTSPPHRKSPPRSSWKQTQRLYRHGGEGGSKPFSLSSLAGEDDREKGERR